MLALSLIVCTNNPRHDYLALCLNALRAQTLPLDEWELVIIDNNSDEPVAKIIDVSWHPYSRLLQEQRIGLTPARIRGIRETTGGLLVFVDDDNVLDPDFLETAKRIGKEMPFLGSWSGQCHPHFEAPPPEWIHRYFGNLVIREFDQDIWSNLPRLAETLPCGAGLCVRRAVANHYVRLHDSGKRPYQLDRSGDTLMSGGDNDLAACSCDIGLGMGLIASLKLTHLMPRERLTEDYIARLAEGVWFSSALLDSARGIPVIPRGTVGRVIDFLRVCRMKPPHRRILRAAYRGRNRAARLLVSSRGNSA